MTAMTEAPTRSALDLVTAMARALGADWTGETLPDDYQHRRESCAILRRHDGVAFWVNVHNDDHYNAAIRNRVTMSRHYGFGETGTALRQQAEYARHQINREAGHAHDHPLGADITATLSKTPAQLAADLRRRLLPDAETIYRTARAMQDADEARATVRARAMRAIMDRAHLLRGATYERPAGHRMRDHDADGTAYVKVGQYGDFGYMSATVKVGTDAERVSVELDYLTVDQARVVFDALSAFQGIATPTT